MKKIGSFFILAILLGTSGGAEENTHQCYLHPFSYDQNFGDVLNIYGCLNSNSFRYYNNYNLQGLRAGINVHIVVAPVATLTKKQLADLQVQIQSVGIPPQVLAFSPVVSNATVVLDWVPTYGGAYDLFVSTTGLQNTDFDGATLGQYNLLLTQQVFQPTPTPSPIPTATAGRSLPTPTPGDRGRRTESPTVTPTPTPRSRARVVGFR